jgi:hypothetical protein
MARKKRKRSGPYPPKVLPKPPPPPPPRMMVSPRDLPPVSIQPSVQIYRSGRWRIRAGNQHGQGQEY